jgi:glycerol kinase
MLPEVKDSSHPFGESTPDLFGGPIAICGIAGDQQAATIGQACFSPGMMKSTYGTGCFALLNTGDTPVKSRARLLTTIAYQIDGKRTYALEGAIFIAGAAVQWLRDGLKILERADESDSLARSVQSTGGVYFVPALVGLGAPHWEPRARAAISGLSFSTGRAHIVRAALEAMAHQTRDLMGAFAADGCAWQELRIDGGMVANDWMAQDLADMLDLTVERPDFVESTALGAAMLAATGAGLYPDLARAAKAMRGTATRFTPALDAAQRKTRLAGWQSALAKVLS